MKKILLIGPPTEVAETIPLGLAYLATVLKINRYEVYAMDGAAPYVNLDTPKIIKEARRISPDIIGITMNIFQIREGYKIANGLLDLGVPLVAGGPFPHTNPKDVLANGFDIVVYGEGEETILELMQWVKGNKPLNEIAGINYKDESGEFITNQSRSFIANLDTLPFPDRSFFPMHNYVNRDNFDNKIFWTTISTSRGCPGSCTYCVANRTFGRKFRLRSAENVYQEIKELNNKYGINIVRFVDDAFTFNRKRILEFCNLLINDKSLKIVWDCDSRINDVDEEMLSKMKEAGCKNIIFGIESGDPETLKNIRKAATIEEINKTLDLAVKVKFEKVKINILVGFPWETKSHIQNSISVLKKYNKLMNVSFGTSVVTPYPATPLYEDYHRDYGFTRWWEDERAFNLVFPKEGKVPFYTKFNLNIDNSVHKRNFFKFSPSFQRYLGRVIIDTGKMVKRRSEGFLRTEIIYIFAFLSYFLYKLNPDLEYIIFSFLYSRSFKLAARKASALMRI